MLSKSVTSAIALCASKFNFSEEEGYKYVISMKRECGSRAGRPLKKRNVLELAGEDIFASLVMSTFEKVEPNSTFSKVEKIEYIIILNQNNITITKQ